MNEFTRTPRANAAPLTAFNYGRERVARALAARFEIQEMLGASHSFERYLAFDTSGGGTVEIKVLSAGAARDFKRRELFYLESLSASRLSHMNIVTTAMAEECDGIHFTVVEHKKDSITLREFLDRNGWLELHSAIEGADQIASALDYAHNAGVLHLKLQPQNILIEPDGWVSVADFGVEAAGEYGWARDQRSQEHRPPYISHEQVAGTSVDRRADLYSLGVILYEMLTDRVPFDSDDDRYIKDRQMSHQPAPPHLIFMDVPECISTIVMRLLEKDPAARFEDAASVQTAIDLAMESGRPI
jgi:serine/threonine-protein kinase